MPAAVIPCQKESYDIIIVGGGTAGCVLANRLSEVPDLSILLLEAGGSHNDDARIKTPALVLQAFGDANVDWDYRTVPQPELYDKQIWHARGKGLGGSSLLNLMALVHPSKAGFDAWAKLGNPEWEWDHIVEYLRKFQTWHAPSDILLRDLRLTHMDARLQGTNGPIQASYQADDSTTIDKAWIDAFHELGYAMKTDTLSGSAIGGYQSTSSIDPVARERSHAGVAYLKDAKYRPNLEIVTGATVDKVILTSTAVPKASGVRFIREGVEYEVNATKEVILSAGAFASPAILERSGIGEEERLTRLGIHPLVSNAGVGENLQDHFLCGVSFEIRDGIETLDNFRDPEFVQAAVTKYEDCRAGPLAKAFASFAYLPVIGEERYADDRFCNVLGKYAASHGRCSLSEKLTRQLLADPREPSANLCIVKGQTHNDKTNPQELFGITQDGHYITFYTALAHPLSRGNIHITSTDPSILPTVDPKYLSHPLDVELTARHVRVLELIAQTDAFKAVVKPGGRRIPEMARFDDLDEVKKLLRLHNLSNQHPSGTCAMMLEDEGGVVDPSLKVYGVQGLRICDASVFPIIPRGNIQTVVYAVAEKGADNIKQDLGYA